MSIELTRSHARTSHKQHKSTRPHITTYTVQSGDTFGSIAQRQGTSVGRLEQLNPNVDPTTLQVGETIRVK